MCFPLFWALSFVFPLYTTCLPWYIALSINMYLTIAYKKKACDHQWKLSKRKVKGEGKKIKGKRKEGEDKGQWPNVFKIISKTPLTRVGITTFVEERLGLPRSRV